ncbi:hypothetical protein ScPMuIL_011161 [Solemya velum]
MTQLYKEELICLQRKVTFCDNKVRDKSPWLFPSIAIASFPWLWEHVDKALDGTDNRSVLRTIFVFVDGIYTGSVYCDRELRNRFKGECIKDNRIFGIKTHDWGNPTQRDVYKKAVFVLRSPYEAVLAWYKFLRSKGHKSNVEERNFHSEGKR